jgi:hypothetical protein
LEHRSKYSLLIEKVRQIETPDIVFCRSFIILFDELLQIFSSENEVFHEILQSSKGWVAIMFYPADWGPVGLNGSERFSGTIVFHFEA